MLVEYTNESFGLNISLNNAEDNFVIRINGSTLLTIPLEFAKVLSTFEYKLLRHLFYWYIRKCEFIKWDAKSTESTLQDMSANVITKCLKVAFTTYLETVEPEPVVNAVIEKVTIHNRVLNADEVKVLYDNER